MARSKNRKTPRWRTFEQDVATEYRNLGAVDVECDVDIAGNQIDVFARVPAADGTFTRCIISCKYYNKRAGVGAVKEWNIVFRALSAANKADKAIITSPLGFSRQAKTLADALGIHLLTPEALRLGRVDFSPYIEATLAEFGENPAFKNRLYIPLHVKFEDEPSVVAATDAIAAFLTDSAMRLLTILGDYGAGKTTLCKSLFQQLGAAFLKKSSSQIMPLYLDLRDYPGQLNLHSFILDVLLNQHDCKCNNFSVIKRLIESRRILLILDAFDEMASRIDYQTTINNFRAIQKLLIPGSKAILTCRTHYFKDQAEIHNVYGGTDLYKLCRGEHYGIAYVQPFGDDEIQQYVHAVLGPEAPQAMERMRDTYDLFGLAQRPILLEMITAVLPDVAKSGKTINSATIYAQYVQHWLRRDDWRVHLSRDDRLRFTLAFAFAMYASGATVFSWDQIKTAINAQWPGTTAKQLEYYEHDIRTCTFLRRNINVYECAHKSFMEYFVASELYRDIVQGSTERFSARLHTAEVFAFLSEHPGTAEARRNIKDWLKEGRSANLVANAFPLLACWEKPLAGMLNHLLVTGQRLTGFSFGEIKFRDLVCKEVRWVRGTWNGCHTEAGQWEDCEWRESSLEDVVFRGEKWSATRLTTCQISNSSLSGCHLDRVTFEATDWDGVDVNDCSLVDCRFVRGSAGMKCQRVSFVRCAFDKFAFSKATFNQSNFIECDCRRARFHGAKIYETRIDKTQWSSESLDGIRFDSVEFQGYKDPSLFGLGGVPPQWNVPPVFSGVKGLSKEIIGELEQMGAKLA